MEKGKKKFTELKLAWEKFYKGCLNLEIGAPLIQKVKKKWKIFTAKSLTIPLAKKNLINESDSAREPVPHTDQGHKNEEVLGPDERLRAESHYSDRDVPDGKLVQRDHLLGDSL
jgi:hypothetical protein